MGKAGIILILSILCFSCINHEQGEDSGLDRLWPNSQVFGEEADENYFDIEYAKGFDIETRENGILIKTFSIEGNEEWADQVWLPHNESDFSKDKKVIEYPLNRIACQSSTYLAYLEKLNALKKVNGLCGMAYVQKQKIIEQLSTNDCQEICLGESVAMETLLDINPQLFLIYPFENTDSEQYSEKGIKTMMMAEYLEKHPLARLEWIKVFGVLCSQYDYAKSFFEQSVKEYNELVSEPISNDNRFILNLPFGDSWNAPSRSSLIVQLCHDAGLDYYFSDEGGTENIIHSKEEMWEIGTDVPFWIIIANRPDGFSMKDLLSEEEVYQEFRAVKENRVIFCNTSTSDYFTYGMIYPHHMLNELLLAIKGEPCEGARYFEILK